MLSNDWDALTWAAAGIVYSVKEPFNVNYLLGMEFAPALSSLRLNYANSEHRS